MELLALEEFEKYVKLNYGHLIDTNSSDVSSELSSRCDSCQRDAFLKIHSRQFQKTYHRDEEHFPRFVTFYLECPTCRRRNFIQTVQTVNINIVGKDSAGRNITNNSYSHYELYRIPTTDNNYANKDIPDEHNSLKETVSEATFCLDHSRYISSAILFRRAIQILCKDILGGKGKTLFNQLEWLKTNKNKLNIDLAEIFHDNAKIIKDIGNQGAHPDDDITLHNFSKDDANGLHDLFISIVHEVFIKPTKIKAIQDDLKKSRKLT